MWEVPRYRIRAYVRAKRRSAWARRDRDQREIHFRKTAAEVRRITATSALGTPSMSPPTPAVVVLNELSAQGVYLFSATPIIAGQQINLTIAYPKLFFVRGRVVGCQRLFSDGRVMQNNRLGYRITIEFEYQSLYEREQVRIYCRELAAQYLYPARGPVVHAADAA